MSGLSANYRRWISRTSSANVLESQTILMHRSERPSHISSDFARTRCDRAARPLARKMMVKERLPSEADGYSCSGNAGW